MLTYYSAKELGVLDETSKDYDVLKGSYGYSLRGSTCSAHDQHLSHKVTRMSALRIGPSRDALQAQSSRRLQLHLHNFPLSRYTPLSTQTP